MHLPVQTTVSKTRPGKRKQVGWTKEYIREESYLSFPCLNKASISSKVLFLVSGTFLYVNIQKIANSTLNGRNV